MISEQIRDHIKARLQGISEADGYYTTPAIVTEGREEFEDDEIPAIVFVGEDEEPFEQRGNKSRTQTTFELHSLITANADHPGRNARRLLADEKRALFSGDQRMEVNGLPVKLRYASANIDYRAAGSGLETARLLVEAVYVEDLENP